MRSFEGHVRRHVMKLDATEVCRFPGPAGEEEATHDDGGTQRIHRRGWKQIHFRCLFFSERPPDGHMVAHARTHDDEVSITITIR
jgi:hypothetical protein